MDRSFLTAYIILGILLALSLFSYYNNRNWDEQWQCLPSGWNLINADDYNKTIGCQITECKEIKKIKNSPVQRCDCNNNTIEFYCTEQFKYRMFTEDEINKNIKN